MEEQIGPPSKTLT